jgi:hypothetical protein
VVVDMDDIKGKKLISELVDEHRAIITVFHQSLEEGVHSQKGLMMLKKAKQDFLDHYEKENVLVYRQLREASRIRGRQLPKNQNISDMAKGFDSNIADIVNMLLEFDATLDGQKESSQSHVEQRLINIVDIIADRIELEENVIFTIYNNLSSQIDDTYTESS